MSEHPTPGDAAGRASLDELRTSRLAALRAVPLPMLPAPISPAGVTDALERLRHDGD